MRFVSQVEPHFFSNFSVAEDLSVNMALCLEPVMSSVLRITWSEIPGLLSKTGGREGLGTYNSLTGFMWFCYFRSMGRV